MELFSHFKIHFIQEGYRGGLTIAHAASVSIQCEGTDQTIQMSNYARSNSYFIRFNFSVLNHSFLYTAECSLGVLTPQTVQCMPVKVPAAAAAAPPRTRDSEYLGEVDFVSSNQDVASILTGFSKINDKFGKSKAIKVKAENSGSYYQHTFGEGKPCGMPKRVEETILYK